MDAIGAPGPSFPCGNTLLRIGAMDLMHASGALELLNNYAATTATAAQHTLQASKVTLVSFNHIAAACIYPPRATHTVTSSALHSNQLP